ncbi:MAG: hypothetical protein O3A14_19585 [Cyanobacteria bacterium]|nr:hypothetical protein [Cyanobacteriota bacterium]
MFAATIIKPGNVVTPEVLANLSTAGQPLNNAVIPLTNLMSVINCVFPLYRPTCIKEIQLPAMNAGNA